MSKQPPKSLEEDDEYEPEMEDAEERLSPIRRPSSNLHASSKGQESSREKKEKRDRKS